MNMDQKSFANIIVLVAIIIALGGVVTYFVLNRQSQLTSAPTPTPGAPISGPITTSGEITCLPKKGTSEQSMECAIGLRGIDGQYYGLKNLSKFDPEYKLYVTGMHANVSGTFSHEEMGGPAGGKYDVVGTIDLTSIKETASGGIKSVTTSTIQPDDPNKTGLALYPDLSVTSLPTKPVSVKFVVEHRSALNGKTITIRGVVVETLLGEKACPTGGGGGLTPGPGACAQPRIFLADTTGESRNKLYDLLVLMSEEEKESSYPIGKTVVLQLDVIDGSKLFVMARKTY